VSNSIESFAPIVTAQSRVLILGSMPGEASLRAGEYYAHPRNAFWQIMGILFAAPVETYEERVKLIEERQLALWDVLKQCERQGSSDSRIVAASMKVNDFTGLFLSHPSIKQIFFNGKRAEKEFRKRVLPFLSPHLRTRLTCATLPSTSPAMTRFTASVKLEQWRAVTVHARTGKNSEHREV
jgi:hypoxanthine-DNA glycosylase